MPQRYFLRTDRPRLVYYRRRQTERPSLTEPLTVERARQGDSHAFGELVRTHQRVAFRVAFVITGSPTEAEEVAQEAFLKAWKNLGSFRAGAAFRPWLLAIVGNEARNRVRARSRRLLRENQVAIPDLAADDPAEEATRAEDSRQVRRAVESLREPERSAIVCRFFLDLSEVETAAVLAIPRGTVKSRLDRARRQLVASLEQQGDTT